MRTAVAGESDEVIAAVEELAGRLRDRGAEIEQDRRLPADVVAALRQARVFQLWMPRELGGLEAEPAAVLQVVETLSAADGSTGWCAATGLASNVVGAFVPEAGARQLYPTGQEMAGGALMPGGRADPQPDGSYLVAGTWSFGSGVQHCDWVVGGAVVTGDGPPQLRAVVMPAAEVEFLDNWDVLGLLGTASVDFRAEGIRVPAEHSLVPDRVSPWPAGSMWRVPLMSLIFPVLAAVPLGLARRAVTELRELAVVKTPFRSGRLLADREVVQAGLARATALIESGHHHLTASMQALWQAAAAGSAPTVEQRAHARLAAAHATAGAAEAVLLCYRSAGSTALYGSNPLQRLLRDVNTATQHYGISAAGYELTGRALLGMEPDPGL
ncbi:acyl-CoA dehydrogenase family protein [Jatrophihabitans sp.]|uniref:acyl-CoA dehydrogenase family protein n=1 Tax=Jatrophihabitans sp. TaxID=1932789 RepID=UPI002F15D207